MGAKNKKYPDSVYQQTKRIMKKNRQKPEIIDLFCGAGGLSLGFEKAGFKILYANDIDNHSVSTYKKNRPNVEPDNIICCDIEDFLKENATKLKRNNCDIVIGGPPCQGFSMANRQRIINDPRNRLYKKFIETISISNPKVFVMENVKGMLGVADQVVDDFNKIGFDCKYQLFNAKNYGIPQNRERLIYVGLNRKKNKSTSEVIDNIFKDISNNHTANEIPLKEAFWGLRTLKTLSTKNATSLESKEFGFFEDKICINKKITTNNSFILKINNGKIPKTIFNHKARYNNERDMKIYELLPPGGKSDHPSIEAIMPYKNRNHIFKDKFFKLLPDKVSKTITSHMKFDCHMYIHPFEGRALTPREAARIQSFPDNYLFLGPYTHWYHQIGNSVPPLLAKIIAESIMKLVFRQKNETNE
jgi:DNA (cytosine-5)-methyltransferase 1